MIRINSIRSFLIGAVTACLLLYTSPAFAQEVPDRQSSAHAVTFVIKDAFTTPGVSLVVRHRAGSKFIAEILASRLGPELVGTAISTVRYMAREHRNVTVPLEMRVPTKVRLRPVSEGDRSAVALIHARLQTAPVLDIKGIGLAKSIDAQIQPH